MLLSRWKLMAGVLGVSIGGLAAAASQCPKWDKSKGRAPEDPVAQIDTKVAPAGPAAHPAPELPAIPGPSSGPAIPAPPQLTPAGATPSAPTPPTVAPALPDFAPTAPKPVPAPPAGVTLPADKPNLPETAPSVPPPPKELMPIGHAPMKPAVTPPAPASDPIPPGVPGPAKPMSATPPAFDLPVPTSRSAGPPAVIGAGAMQPAQPPGVSPPGAPGMAPAQIDLPAAPPVETTIAKPAAPAPTAPTPAAPESKFRILLRVGEGEPTFEVKNGDNLVLKVACEKVDIKSPEKGSGLSEVTARGKVRFAGFGAEGTCDELKFFAGNGEVSMSGEVKVIVRDKLGRVESELTGAGPLKYKIDASSVGGQIRP
jgi:hypothetical protein